MTQAPPPSPPHPQPPETPHVPTVVPTAGSRLDGLVARHDAVKRAKKEAETAEQELTTAIKAELSLLLPEGATEILLSSPWLEMPLSLRQVSKWRFDTRRCKADFPEVYAALAKQASEWHLRPVT